MPLFVITGASQGIGAASARRLAREPEARLALLARSAANLEQVAEACRAEGAAAAAFPCDVTLPDEVDTAVESIVKRHGAPDLLFNNAGLFLPGEVRDTSVEDWRSMLDVNLTSAFLVTRAFLPAMEARRQGMIAFSSSVASIRGYPGGAAYCAAKHALLGLARVLREETREHGIRVTSLLMGATWSPSWEGSDLPEERFVDPEDVAETLAGLYRLSDRTVVEEVLIRPQLGDL